MAVVAIYNHSTGKTRLISRMALLAFVFGANAAAAAAESVPNLVGLTADEAIIELIDRGIEAEKISLPVHGVQVGYVARQFPAADASITSDVEVVFVTVSTSDRRVPALEGKRLDRAFSELNDVGLIAVENPADPSLPGNAYYRRDPLCGLSYTRIVTVTEIEPAAGTWLPQGATVTLRYKTTESSFNNPCTEEGVPL